MQANFEIRAFFTSYRSNLPFPKTNLILPVSLRNAFNQVRVPPARFTRDFSAVRRVCLNNSRTLNFSATLEYSAVPPAPV